MSVLNTRNLTMSQGYFANGYRERITYFDEFFQQCPDDGGFAITVDLDQIIEYIQQLHFSREDIDYLRERKLIGEDFLGYLQDFRFTSESWAVPEGTPVCFKEPIFTVRTPAIETQLIEMFFLLSINHQSLIATKGNPVGRGAQGDTVWDEVKRFNYPHTCYVERSEKLWNINYGLMRNNYEA